MLTEVGAVRDDQPLLPVLQTCGHAARGQPSRQEGQAGPAPRHPRAREHEGRPGYLPLQRARSLPQGRPTSPRGASVLARPGLVSRLRLPMAPLAPSLRSGPEAEARFLLGPRQGVRASGRLPLDSLRGEQLAVMPWPVASATACPQEPPGATSFPVGGAGPAVPSPGRTSGFPGELHQIPGLADCEPPGATPVLRAPANAEPHGQSPGPWAALLSASWAKTSFLHSQSPREAGGARRAGEADPTPALQNPPRGRSPTRRWGLARAGEHGWGLGPTFLLILFCFFEQAR